MSSVKNVDIGEFLSHFNLLDITYLPRYNICRKGNKCWSPDCYQVKCTNAIEAFVLLDKSGLSFEVAKTFE